jgi:hypothetical protein
MNIEIKLGYDFFIHHSIENGKIIEHLSDILGLEGHNTGIV